MKDEAHLARIRKLPCCVCGNKSVPHHIRDGSAGAGQKASDYETIPLCDYHHTGAQGFHIIGRETWEKVYGLQRDHLKNTLELLRKKYGKLPFV